MVKNKIPIDSIRLIVNYLIESEGKHYEESICDENNQGKHIYEHTLEVKKWLHSNY